MKNLRCTAVVRTVAALTCGLVGLLSAPPCHAQADFGERLAAKCLEAKAKFQPVTPSQIAERLTAFQAALDRLDKRLKDEGENGQAWRSYLRLDELRKELGQEKPAFALLNEVKKALDAGHEGLGLIWFIEARDALDSYMRAVQASRPQWQPVHEALLTQAADLMKLYGAPEKKPIGQWAAEVGRAVRFLELTGQAPELVAEVRGQFSQPNLWGYFSRELAGGGIDGPTDDTMPLRDCMLGVAVFGTSRTIGQTRGELRPDEHHALLDTVFYGQAHSDTVGYRGPVSAYSTAETRLAAVKRVWLDENGFHWYGTVSRATTDTNTHTICTRRGSRLVQRIAWRKAMQQKSQAEYLASRKAERELNKRVDEESDKALTETNREFHQKVRQPLWEQRLLPRQLQFASSDGSAQLVALQMGAAQLAAPGEPPALPAGADLAVRVHHSLIDNSGVAAFAGMTVRDEALRQRIADLLGEVPERMKPKPNDPKLTLVFPPREPTGKQRLRPPVRVEFDKGVVTIVVSIEAFQENENRYQMPLDVVVKYKFEKAAEGFRAVRLDEIAITDPEYTGAEAVPAKVQATADTLRPHMEKVFGKEFTLGGFELSGRWAKLGRLQPFELRAEGGWLTLGWKLTAAPQTAAPQTPTPAAAKS